MKEQAGLIIGRVKWFSSLEIDDCVLLNPYSETTTSVWVSLKEISLYSNIISVWHTHNSLNFFPSFTDYASAIKLKKRGISYITIYSTKLNFSITYKVFKIACVYLIAPIILLNNRLLDKAIAKTIKCH